MPCQHRPHHPISGRHLNAWLVDYGSGTGGVGTAFGCCEVDRCTGNQNAENACIDPTLGDMAYMSSQDQSAIAAVALLPVCSAQNSQCAASMQATNAWDAHNWGCQLTASIFIAVPDPASASASASASAEANGNGNDPNNTGARQAATMTITEVETDATTVRTAVRTVTSRARVTFSGVAVLDGAANPVQTPPSNTTNAAVDANGNSGNDSGGGSSKSEQAGLIAGIVSAVAAVLALVLGYFQYRQRRNRRRREQEAVQMAAMAAQQAAPQPSPPPASPPVRPPLVAQSVSGDISAPNAGHTVGGIHIGSYSADHLFHGGTNSSVHNHHVWNMGSPGAAPSTSSQSSPSSQGSTNAPASGSGAPTFSSTSIPLLLQQQQQHQGQPSPGLSAGPNRPLALMERDSSQSSPGPTANQHAAYGSNSGFEYGSRPNGNHLGSQANGPSVRPTASPLANGNTKHGGAGLSSEDRERQEEAFYLSRK